MQHKYGIGDRVHRLHIEEITEEEVDMGKHAKPEGPDKGFDEQWEQSWKESQDNPRTLQETVDRYCEVRREVAEEKKRR